MREILFRGKRVDNGEWVAGCFGHHTSLDAFIIKRPYPDIHGEISALGFWNVNPFTVGQYTGLTDKNGKKIFEGDIVEHHVQGDILVNRGFVEWDGRNGRWVHHLNTMSPDFSLYNPAAFEVIGNIHDNPELIGGTNE